MKRLLAFGAALLLLALAVALFPEMLPADQSSFVLSRDGIGFSNGSLPDRLHFLLLTPALLVPSAAALLAVLVALIVAFRTRERSPGVPSLAFAAASVLFLGFAVALRPATIPARYHYYSFAPEANPGLVGRALSSLQPDPAAWLPSATVLLTAITAFIVAALLARRAKRT